VVEDIAAIARSPFGAIADPHANGGLLVGGVTAPVGFPADSAASYLLTRQKPLIAIRCRCGELMILHWLVLGIWTGIGPRC